MSKKNQVNSEKAKAFDKIKNIYFNSNYDDTSAVIKFFVEVGAVLVSAEEKERKIKGKNEYE